MANCGCGCGLEAGVITRSRPHLGMVKGEPRRFAKGHGRRGVHAPRVSAVQSYRQVTVVPGTRSVTLHRMRAERALGKPLPVGAVVHHADGSRDDNAPLVICQNDSYHKLLHARMRVKSAGGNPDTDAVCGICRRAKSRELFHVRSGQVFGVRDACISCERNRQIAARG